MTVQLPQREARGYYRFAPTKKCNVAGSRIRYCPVCQRRDGLLESTTALFLIETSMPFPSVAAGFGSNHVYWLASGLNRLAG